VCPLLACLLACAALGLQYSADAAVQALAAQLDACRAALIDKDAVIEGLQSALDAANVRAGGRWGVSCLAPLHTPPCVTVLATSCLVTGPSHVFAVRPRNCFPAGCVDVVRTRALFGGAGECPAAVARALARARAYTSVGVSGVGGTQLGACRSPHPGPAAATRDRHTRRPGFFASARGVANEHTFVGLEEVVFNIFGGRLVVSSVSGFFICGLRVQPRLTVPVPRALAVPCDAKWAASREHSRSPTSNPTGRRCRHR
jgi:hypothetical protein